MSPEELVNIRLMKHILATERRHEAVHSMVDTHMRKHIHRIPHEYLHELVLVLERGLETFARAPAHTSTQTYTSSCVAGHAIEVTA